MLMLKQGLTALFSVENAAAGSGARTSSLKMCTDKLQGACALQHAWRSSCTKEKIPILLQLTAALLRSFKQQKSDGSSAL